MNEPINGQRATKHKPIAQRTPSANTKHNNRDKHRQRTTHKEREQHIKEHDGRQRFAQFFGQNDNLDPYLTICLFHRFEV